MGVVERRALSEQVHDFLLERIMSSQLEPGQRLKEAAIGEELGVSRTPVREALKRLVGSGFVTMIPRRGVFASEVDSRRLAEILDLRYLFEMYAAERGVERISQEDLSEMRSLVEECESIVGSSDRLEFSRYVQKERDFHRLIVRIAGNSFLVELYERLGVFLQIARMRSFQSRPDVTKGHGEHKAIVEAYEMRDEDRLLHVLGSHLTRSRNELLEIAERAMAGVGAESTHVTGGLEPAGNSYPATKGSP